MRSKHLIRRGALLLALLIGVASAPARADVAWHLDAIGWGEAVEDSRWADVLTYGADQHIAVFDTGIDTGHAMLADRSVTGRTFVEPVPATGPAWGDMHGHGSAVASVAAGHAGTLGGRIDFAGVASAADLLSVRVLDNTGAGSFYEINNALAWLIDLVDAGWGNVQAVNLSLGSESAYASPGHVAGSVVDTFNDHAATLREMGIPVIAAAGNAGSTTGLSFPAISDDVIAVGATTSAGGFAAFSNRGPALDLAAPGQAIWGAYPILGDSVAGQWDGTSFAAPQVAGAVLLINEVYEHAHGRLPTHEELTALLATSRTMITDPATGVAVPQLDVYAALDAAYAAAAVPEPGTLWMLAVGVYVLSQRRSARGAFPGPRQGGIVGGRAPELVLGKGFSAWVRLPGRQSSFWAMCARAPRWSSASWGCIRT